MDKETARSWFIRGVLFRDEMAEITHGSIARESHPSFTETVDRFDEEWADNEKFLSTGNELLSPLVDEQEYSESSEYLSDEITKKFIASLKNK